MDSTNSGKDFENSMKIIFFYMKFSCWISNRMYFGFDIWEP